MTDYFTSVSSGREYLRMLAESLAENLADVVKQEATATGRTKDALKIVRYKMLVGAEHLKRAEKVLHDLERLKELLCQ